MGRSRHLRSSGGAVDTKFNRLSRSDRSAAGITDLFHTIVNATVHTPVLYQAVLKALAPQSGCLYIDGTIGGAGHAEGILLASHPQGRLLGIDADPRAIERGRLRLEPFAERVVLTHGNFGHLAEIAEKHGFTSASGILLDLGVSSDQLDDPNQGFSFRQTGPLDLRLDPTRGESAADVVNTRNAEELADIIYRYGEERKSRRIARAIVSARPIETTSQLADVIGKAVGGRRGARIHPATRTFQALRIYVNDEIAVLQAALPQAIDLLTRGGVLAVISFHSLEDRVVKQFFRHESRDCICPPKIPFCQCDHRASIVELYRKGQIPTPEETVSNPRSRSARLRAARKL